jgi:peroxiredoxin
VIAPDGKVLLAYSALDPAGHVEKSMAAVTAWRKAHPVQ